MSLTYFLHNNVIAEKTSDNISYILKKIKWSWNSNPNSYHLLHEGTFTLKNNSWFLKEGNHALRRRLNNRFNKDINNTVSLCFKNNSIG